ncbi:MAG: hypothetical protein ACTSUE_03865 [Promethearchaeota archaeon]
MHNTIRGSVKDWSKHVPDTKETNPKYLVKANKIPMTTTEKDQSLVLVKAMKFDVLSVGTNFESNADTPYPFDGYAASMYGSSNFCPEAFLQPNMFFGTCLGQLSVGSGAHGTTDITNVKRWFRNLNTYLRDKSPNPPTMDSDPNGNDWECSLGNGGVVSLEELHDDGVYKVFIRVSAGLDPSLELQFVRFIQKEEHLESTYQDMYPYFEKMKALSENNRQRIMAVAAHCLGVELVYRAPNNLYMVPSDFVMEPIAALNRKMKDIADEVLNWLPEDVDIPVWYQVPMRQIKQTPAMPESIFGFRIGAYIHQLVTDKPKAEQKLYMERLLNGGPARLEEKQTQGMYIRRLYYSPMTTRIVADTMVNVMESSEDGKYVFYSNCTNTKICPEGVVMFDSPLSDLRILNPNLPMLGELTQLPEHTWNPTATLFGEFPTVYNFKVTKECLEVSCENSHDNLVTWEDDTLAKNRNVIGEYSLKTLQELQDTKNTGSMTPTTFPRIEKLTSKCSTARRKGTRCSSTDRYGNWDNLTHNKTRLNAFGQPKYDYM